MASATASVVPSFHSQRKNLKCGICQDVYRSPKLLPCFHTFCCQCLEQLIQVKGSRFQCPACRSLTHVPEGGAAQFQSNMYITESELEKARENLIYCRVHVSYDEPLTFFCVTCDDAICLRCKLTKHEGHRCEDLFKADERSRRLAGAKRELDDVMESVEVKVKGSEDQLRQIERKKDMLVQQVHARHDSLVAMATKWRNNVLRDIHKTTEMIQTNVTSERDQLMTQLSTCHVQRKRVQHIIDNLSDVAEAERVLRTCSETDNTRKRVKVLPSESSVHLPGLHYAQDAILEDNVRRYMGVATLLRLPKAGPVQETLTRFCQCLEDGHPRQVLGLCVTSEGNVHFMYEDVTLGGRQWGKRTVSSTAQILRDTKVSQRFIFKKYSGGGKFCISHHSVNEGICLNSKSGSLAQLMYLPAGSEGAASCSVSDVLVMDDLTGNQPKVSNHKVVQNICTMGKPVALDVTADNTLLAVVEEVTGKTADRPEQAYFSPGRRLVRLYRRGQEDCVATYQPPDPRYFFPTDVCFWRHGGKEKLLVGDYSNDSVHVINVQALHAHQGRCVMERFLAAGHGDLVKPTAFDTDAQGRLWIGCANGWILKCEAGSAAAGDTPADDAKDCAERKCNRLLVERLDEVSSQSQSASPFPGLPVKKEGKE